MQVGLQVVPIAHHSSTSEAVLAIRQLLVGISVSIQMSMEAMVDEGFPFRRSEVSVPHRAE